MKELKKQDVDFKTKRFYNNNYKAIIFLIALFCFYECHPKDKDIKKYPPSSEKSPTTRLVFKKEIHNFGKVKDGEIVYTSFYFKNRGNKPITIQGFKKSCGCITIKGPVEPILPGKEDRIVVTFDTTGEWGKQMKTLNVYTSENFSYSLMITAIVNNELFQNLSN
ncbi:DUF1573 domain-containing protein [Halosquirtibacter xylanolyticus]|uniref:DUF1573 domain-containing protein n=1 Tax=Halosquirtibacter xylanolyticus TaxID=3374599 RepID=UPI0037483AF2|nr:DUF1573 domain-containing protein [Prolixibacteraceae bacterium]